MRLILLFCFLSAGVHAQMKYKLVPDWPNEVLSAAGAPAGPWNLIQAPGIAVDSGGHVLIFHRGAHPILEFESGGKFVALLGVMACSARQSRLRRPEFPQARGVRLFGCIRPRRL